MFVGNYLAAENFGRENLATLRIPNFKLLHVHPGV